MTPQTYVFFGTSGSGKGTQAKLLKEFLEEKDTRKVLYLETGEKLREFSQGDSLTAHKTKEVLEGGGLMPEFMPVWVWSQFFIENVTGEEHVILDGVARREHEAVIVDSLMQFYKIKDPKIIFINVSPEWAIDKLEKRAELENRADDKEAQIKKRMEWFLNNVMPAIKHFKDNNYYEFIEINGEQTIEEVHQEILDKCSLK